MRIGRIQGQDKDSDRDSKKLEKGIGDRNRDKDGGIQPPTESLSSYLIDRVASCIGGLHTCDHFGLLPHPQHQVPFWGAPLGRQQTAIRAEGHAGNLLQDCQPGERQQG